MGNNCCSNIKIYKKPTSEKLLIDLFKNMNITKINFYQLREIINKYKSYEEIKQNKENQQLHRLDPILYELLVSELINEEYFKIKYYEYLKTIEEITSTCVKDRAFQKELLTFGNISTEYEQIETFRRLNFYKKNGKLLKKEEEFKSTSSKNLLLSYKNEVSNEKSLLLSLQRGLFPDSVKVSSYFIVFVVSYINLNKENIYPLDIARNIIEIIHEGNNELSEYISNLNIINDDNLNTNESLNMNMNTDMIISDRENKKEKKKKYNSKSNQKDNKTSKVEFFNDYNIDINNNNNYNDNNDIDLSSNSKKLSSSYKKLIPNQKTSNKSVVALNEIKKVKEESFSKKTYTFNRFSEEIINKINDLDNLDLNDSQNYTNPHLLSSSSLSNDGKKIINFNHSNDSSYESNVVDDEKGKNDVSNNDNNDNNKYKININYKSNSKISINSQKDNLNHIPTNTSNLNNISMNLKEQNLLKPKLRSSKVKFDMQVKETTTGFKINKLTSSLSNIMPISVFTIKKGNYISTSKFLSFLKMYLKYNLLDLTKMFYKYICLENHNQYYLNYVLGVSINEKLIEDLKEEFKIMYSQKLFIQYYMNIKELLKRTIFEYKHGNEGNRCLTDGRNYCSNEINQSNRVLLNLESEYSGLNEEIISKFISDNQYLVNLNLLREDYYDFCFFNFK